MGFAANSLNIVEQYKYILQDLGAKVIDTQYIVPLPAELLPAALSPKYFLILMPAEETRGYPFPGNRSSTSYHRRVSRPFRGNSLQPFNAVQRTASGKRSFTR